MSHVDRRVRLILPQDAPGETSTDDITDTLDTVTPPRPDRHRVLQLNKEAKEFIETKNKVNLNRDHNQNNNNRSLIIQRPEVPQRRRPKEKLLFTSQVLSIMTSVISLLGKTQHHDF